MIFLALGPLVGGLLTEGWTWRAVFWINIPVGVVMLALAAVTLPRDERDREARFDWPGAFTLVPGLVAIVLALMQAQSWGWSSAATISLLACGGVLVVVFVFVELRARWPLVAPGLFRSRNFTVDNVVLGLVQFALTGITVFGAIYVQDLLGFTPIEAGLSLLPLTLPLLLLAPRAGRIYDRVGPRVLVAAGAALLGGSLIWAGLVLDQLDYWWLVPGLHRVGARARAGHDAGLDRRHEHRALGAARRGLGRHADDAPGRRHRRPRDHGHRGGDDPVEPARRLRRSGRGLPRAAGAVRAGALRGSGRPLGPGGPAPRDRQ